LTYNQVIRNLQQTAANSDEQFLQQLAAKLFTLPWGHHLLLIDKFPNHPEKIEGTIPTIKEIEAKLNEKIEQ